MTTSVNDSICITFVCVIKNHNLWNKIKYLLYEVSNMINMQTNCSILLFCVSFLDIMFVFLGWTLLCLVPFSCVDAPFETIRYCGFEWWNNCVQCWFPKWFWMVGQLIQNLVWIFPNSSTANTKPCLDTSKWWINGPSKTIWMDLNGSNSLLPTLFKWYHHVCTKPMGIFESGNFEWFQMVYQ